MVGPELFAKNNNIGRTGLHRNRMFQALKHLGNKTELGIDRCYEKVGLGSIHSGLHLLGYFERALAISLTSQRNSHIGARREVVFRQRLGLLKGRNGLVKSIEPSQLYAQKHMRSVVTWIEFDAVLHLPKSEIVLSSESIGVSQIKIDGSG